MSNKEEMLTMLPPDYHKSKDFMGLVTATGKQFDDMDSFIDDLLNQQYVDTATWTLARRERLFRIHSNPSKPLSERRSVIKSRMRGGGKIDATRLKNIADSYTNGNVEVDFDGRIIIRFTSVLGIPPNLDDLKSAIDDVKPASLRVIYEFAYLTVADIERLSIAALEQTTLDKFAGGV